MIKIQKTRIIGTRVIRFSAWERSPVQRLLELPYSTITTFDGEWFGQIGTERLPPEIDRLPSRSDARMEAYDGWRSELERHAHELIIAEYPEAVHGRIDGNEIEIILPE